MSFPARRATLILAILAFVAGCATPEESAAPTDLDRDKDNNGIPDDEERNTTDRSANRTLPGLEIPGVPDEPQI